MTTSSDSTNYFQLSRIIQMKHLTRDLSSIGTKPVIINGLEQ